MNICLNLGFISLYLSVESGNTFVTQRVNDNDYELIEMVFLSDNMRSEGYKNACLRAKEHIKDRFL